ncbi:MAG: hypothetical protein WCH79_20845, partial [Planctomycetia bacterium]
VLTATDASVFTVPNDWGASGVQLLRMNAKDGSFAPFVRDGKELPMPLHFRDLLGLAEGIAPPKARALAVGDGVLILATDDDRLWLFDAATAALIKQTKLELTGVHGGQGHHASDRYPFAFDGKQLYCFRQKELVKIGLESLKSEADPMAKAVVIPLNGAVEQPGAIALDASGTIFITNLGNDLQVKKFAPDGRLLGRIGKTGGRARQGAFEPQGMREMSSIAVDAAGHAWVAEYSDHPRRVSVWKPDGTLLRDFIGNTGYAGQGSFTHDSDPTKGVAELNEIRLDPATRTWNVESVMYNADPAKGDFVMPGSTAFGSGNVFFSSASGAKHEYFVSLGEFRNTPVFVMIKAGKAWQPVAGIFSVARLQGLLGGQYGEYAAKHNRIEAEISRRQAEWRSTQELVRKLEQTLPIATQRAQDFKNLVDSDFMSKHGYMEREQVRIEQEADLANQRSRLLEIEAGLREARGQLSSMTAETRRLSLDSIIDAQQKVGALEQELLKAE